MDLFKDAINVGAKSMDLNGKGAQILSFFHDGDITLSVNKRNLFCIFKEKGVSSPSGSELESFLESFRRVPLLEQNRKVVL